MDAKRRRVPLTALDVFGILAFYVLGFLCLGLFTAYHLRLLPFAVPDDEFAQFMTFLGVSTVGLLGPCLLGFAIWIHLEWWFGWREKRKA